MRNKILLRNLIVTDARGLLFSHNRLVIQEMSDTKEVTVIGGGLVGSLSACFLAKRHYNVTLYEKRKDIRKDVKDTGKSINLALSNRGRKALRILGLEDTVLSYAVPMKGRLIHDLSGNTHFFPYDPLKKQNLYSINRNTLNGLLLTVAEDNFNVKTNFQHELINVDMDACTVQLKNLQTEETINNWSNKIIGADGAHSSIRKIIMGQTHMSFSQKYIEHGYIELGVKANKGRSLRPNCLHIWPRKTFMLIALPNLDESWTVTLFMPLQKFEEIETLNCGLEFFENTFSDAVNLIGEEQIVEMLSRNKARPLISIFCHPYHFGESILLMGDAAHAMVPFYGQGMNAGFEDCTILNGLLEDCESDFAKAIKEFTRARNADAHAICELAMYNYKEMRNLVTTKSYRLRKIIDEFLYFIIPEVWIPLYVSVTFTDLDYKKCLDNKKWQDKVIQIVLIGMAILGILLCWWYVSAK